MPVNIHGKQYITVAERASEAHKKLKTLDITTEVLRDEPVVIKATIKTEKGTYTGISAANPSKTIEKTNPYEVAETSAVGRALGFAGFGIVEGIASADEMAKSGIENEPQTPIEPSMATEKQRQLIYILYKEKNNVEMPEEEKEKIRQLTSKQASDLITKWKEKSEPKEEVDEEEVKLDDIPF